MQSMYNIFLLFGSQVECFILSCLDLALYADKYLEMYKLYPAWHIGCRTVGSDVRNMLYIGGKPDLDILVFIFI